MEFQVPVITANVPIDPSCLYSVGSFPHFKGLTDSVTYVFAMSYPFIFQIDDLFIATPTYQLCFCGSIMNGINAPKVVECLGSDGNKYRQLAKSGNDDLRQDAVRVTGLFLIELFFCNTVGIQCYIYIFILCYRIRCDNLENIISITRLRIVEIQKLETLVQLQF